MKTRTKWISAVLMTLLLAGGAYAFARPATPASPVTDTVRLGNLLQTVESTGDVRPLEDIDLSFDASGTVEAVMVGIGDAVRAGETLAALDAGELEAAYAKALSSVERAEAELALERVGATAEAVAEAEAAVAVAEAALASAQSDAVQVADVNAAADADAAAEEETARANLAEAVRALVAEVRHALSVADTVLGVENPFYNRDFRALLASNDSEALEDASVAFVAAQQTRDAAEELLLALDTSDATAVAVASDAAQQAYADAYAVLLGTNRVLDATTADSSDFSLDDQTALKASVSAELSALVADGSALSSAELSFADASRAVRSETQTQAERTRALAAADSAVTAREADLAKAQAALASLVAVPRAEDLAPFEVSVRSAQSDADAALARLQKTRIVSPIDGVVTSVALDPGESASAGVSALTVLSAGNDFEISMDVPEADVAKMAVGAAADVTFDALGDDRAFAGTLVSVEPAQKIIEGVVFYEATVLLAPNDGFAAVKPGMSANVTIKTASRTNVLFVPSRAVLEDDGTKYVRVPTADGAFERRTVTTGLRADDGLVEILSGVSEGETVIVSLAR